MSTDLPTVAPSTEKEEPFVLDRQIYDVLNLLATMAAPSVNGAPVLDNNGSLPKTSDLAPLSQPLRGAPGSKMYDGPRKSLGSSEEQK